MPGEIISLNPRVSPQEYFNANQAKLSVVPDGTGLQILFKVKGEYYILAGVRTGKVITVNGGTIDKPRTQEPFAAQLAEELNEETFGVLSLAYDETRGYELILNDGSRHALSMQDEHAFMVHKPGKYAYVTFTAVCQSLTLAQLNTLAEAMTPTAHFWNEIGNDLFKKSADAPQDTSFAQYWESHRPGRTQLIANLVETHKQLTASGTPLLIDPTDVFQAETLEESLDKLHQIADYAAFDTMFRHTVGAYSERSGYHVFPASELARVAALPIDVADKSVKDAHGQKVTNQGIYNPDPVAVVIPALIKEATPSVVPVSVFPSASTSSDAPTLVTLHGHYNR